MGERKIETSCVKYEKNLTSIDSQFGVSLVLENYKPEKEQEIKAAFDSFCKHVEEM